MPNFDIYTFAPSMTVMMPFAGAGQSFRLYAPRYASSVTPAEAVPAPRRNGLLMCWRIDSEGQLVMEWTA
jgi:hypothetical protein